MRDAKTPRHRDGILEVLWEDSEVDFYRETKRAKADGLTRKQAQDLVTMGKIILLVSRSSF